MAGSSQPPLPIVPAVEEDPDMIYIPQISSETRIPWKIKVIVVDKTFPKDSRSTNTRFQNLTLADENGARIQAVIFGQDILMFQNTLIMMRQYIISNAVIKPSLPAFRTVPHLYQLTINYKTLIDEVFGPPPQIALANDFIRFSQLGQGRNSQGANIIGIAVQCLEPRWVNYGKGDSLIQEFLLLDKGLKPATLTLWNQYVHNEGEAIAAIIKTRPIIIGYRLKITAYGEPALSTWNKSCIIVNPSLQEAMQLRGFVTANKDAIDIAMEKESLNKRTTTNLNNTIEMLEVQALPWVQGNKTYSVMASIQPVKIMTKCWYMGCSNCFRGTSASYLNNYTCHNCAGIETHALPRARLEAKLEDATGTIQGAFYGKDAEELLGVTAHEMFEATTKGKLSELAPRIKEASRDAQRLFVRISERSGERRYIFSFPPSTIVEIQPLAIELPKTISATTAEEGSSANQTSQTKNVEINPDIHFTPKSKKILAFEASELSDEGDFPAAATPIAKNEDKTDTTSAGEAKTTAKGKKRVGK